MSEKSFNLIWSGIALIALFTALNSALQTQGSELFVAFPDVKGAGKAAVTVYGMLISIPLFLLLIRMSEIFQTEYPSSNWAACIPVAFNREIYPDSKLGKNYQKFSIGTFFILPMLLEAHLLRKFFQGCIFPKACDKLPTELCENLIDGCLSCNAWMHLTTFVPIPYSFENYYGYAEKANSNVGDITFFPGWESWFLLLLVVFYLFYNTRFLVLLFTRKG